LPSAVHSGSLILPTCSSVTVAAPWLSLQLLTKLKKCKQWITWWLAITRNRSVVSAAHFLRVFFFFFSRLAPGA
jgi:hypothetical protein